METEEETQKTDAVEQPQTSPALDLAEQVKTLQAQRDRLTEDLLDARKGLTTAGLTLKQRDEALRNQQAIRDELEAVRTDFSEKFKLLAGYVAQSKSGQPEDFEQAQATRPADLLKQFEEAEQKRLADLKFKQDMQTVSGYEQRVLALGLKPDDEDYLDIQDKVVTMNPIKLKLADTKLKKLEEAKMVAKLEGKKSDVKVETEGERIKRLVSEGLRTEMEKRGMLTPEGGIPSSGGESHYRLSDIPRLQVEIASMPDGAAKREANKKLLTAMRDGRVRS